MTEEPLRCVIDAMVFDAIADEPDQLTRLDRLTRAHRVELLAVLATMEEIGATPDPDRRRRLQKVRVLVLPPPEGPAAERTLLALAARPGVSEEDASAAVAAAARGVPLVTEDRALRAAVGALLPDVVVWGWETKLRPALARLSRPD